MDRRKLEIAAFVAVFVVGTALAALAITGGKEEPKRVAVTEPSVQPPVVPSSQPPPTSSSFPPVPPPSSAPVVPIGEVTVFGQRSSGTISGCTAHLNFQWEVQPPGPRSGQAVIEFTGPNSVKRYTRPVSGGNITLDLSVPLGPFGQNHWSAKVVTVAGKSVQDIPPASLDESFDVPGGPGC